MKAAMLAHDLIAAGSAAIVSPAAWRACRTHPISSIKARAGYRLGHGRVLDHMFLDGLEDAYDKGRLDGHLCRGRRPKPTSSPARPRMRYAIEFLRRAKRAGEDGLFAAEIVAGVR